MTHTNKWNLRKLWRSFGFALTGIREMIGSEQNARIHLIVTAGVVIAGLLLHLSIVEWCIICVCVGLVLAAEAFNTALEKLADHVFPGRHETARQVKDIAAGAVLISAAMSAVCGILIFLPKLLQFLL